MLKMQMHINTRYSSPHDWPMFFMEDWHAPFCTCMCAYIATYREKTMKNQDIKKKKTSRSMVMRMMYDDVAVDHHDRDDHHHDKHMIFLFTGSVPANNGRSTLIVQALPKPCRWITITTKVRENPKTPPWAAILNVGFRQPAKWIAMKHHSCPVGNHHTMDGGHASLIYGYPSNYQLSSPACRCEWFHAWRTSLNRDTRSEA